MNYTGNRNYTYEGRDAIRRRRELRRRKRRQKAIITFLLIITIAFSVCAIYCLKEISRDDVVSNKKIEIDQTKSNETQVSAKDETKIMSQSTSNVESTQEPEVYKYNELPYYEPDNQERYEEYQEKNPDMKASDIVWRVNSNLDKDFYQADIPIDGYDDPYIIVNKYYKVPDGYKPPDLVDVGGQKMRKATADAYLKMKSDAEGQGYQIRAVSAYRTVEYQKNLYNRYLDSDNQYNVDRYSARAGHSEHHTGMALDLFGSVDGLRNFVKTPEYTWVRDNGYKYGFIIRYQADIENITGYEDEPWHIRYVGVDVSTDMRNKGIKSYEEYYEKYLKKR